MIDFSDPEGENVSHNTSYDSANNNNKN
jgi:hypothetical protein